MASDQRLPKRLTGQERPNPSSLPICPMQKMPSIAARDSLSVAERTGLPAVEQPARPPA